MNLTTITVSVDVYHDHDTEELAEDVSLAVARYLRGRGCEVDSGMFHAREIAPTGDNPAHTAGE